MENILQQFTWFFKFMPISCIFEKKLYKNKKWFSVLQKYTTTQWLIKISVSNQRKLCLVSRQHNAKKFYKLKCYIICFSEVLKKGYVCHLSLQFMK